MVKKNKEAPEEKVSSENKEEEIKSESSNGLKKIKVEQDELLNLQKEGVLVGYDPKTKEAIIRS